MNRFTTATLLVICAAVVSAGMAIRTVLSPAGQIAIYPSHVQFNEGHLEGELLEVHLELKNESAQPVEITSLSRSCGCMGVFGKDEALTPPFPIDKGATCPITLTVATGGRVGANTFGIMVTAEGPRGIPLRSQAEVEVNLRSALRAQPDMIILRRAKAGTVAMSEVKLADAVPDPGVRIREIKLSNPKTMQVEVTPETGASSIFGDEAGGRARGILKLTYVPDATEGRIQELISIVPEDGRFPTLQIPVYCEIAEGPFRFSPRGLTIAGEVGQTFRRTVVFQSDEPDTTIAVAQVPEGLSVDIGEPTATTRAISIRGDLAVLKKGSHDVVFEVNGHEHVLPIRIASVN